MSETKDTANGPKIKVGDISVTYLDSHQTILNCLEAANVEVHFHCRDGFCGACRITLDEGQVNYPQGEPLAFVGDGEILACCCQPVTDIKVTIE